MKSRLFTTFLLTILIVFSAKAQYDLPFGFEKKYDFQALDEQGNFIVNAWAGGLYAVQLGEVDLDNDGIKDLVVFDRYGNRTLTYKNNGVPNLISFQFSPYLAEKLPRFSDWVIFADYNMDGLNDIFTYSKGFAGIIVYLNKGHEAEEQFELVVSPYLTSFQGVGYVNILVTYADYPAIVDIDGDGDLDILTFWGLGSFVELHTNESMELYGVPDSLIYRKTENCWGQFAESDESNLLYLDTCFTFSGKDDSAGVQIEKVSAVNFENDEFRHTGSTFLIFDENGDGLDDLVLGDVDFAAPALLTNAGTQEEALMESYTFTWPAYDVPINLMSFPLIASIDINNNGKKDLIVSVFDPSLVKSENIDNIWFYENVSESNAPEFHLREKSFLQNQMLDFGAGAAPVFFDYNHDGLLDILVGNFGYLDTCFYGFGQNLNCQYSGQLALLENIGTNDLPIFKLVNRNFADLPGYFSIGERPYALVPTLADLDGDGDEDMLLGNAWGNLFYFENFAAPGLPAEFTLADENFQGITVGSYSAPQLFDLSLDGLPDLVVGHRNGTISYWQNTGTGDNPVFTFVTDSLGGVDVRNPNLSIYGYCVPHFFSDKDGKTHLFAGSEFGEIFYYSGIDDNLEGKFKLVMKNYLWIDEGLRSTIAVSNLNADSFPDMLVGNYSGGLSFFKGVSPPPAGAFEGVVPQVEIMVFPNPSSDVVQLKMPENPRIQMLGYTIFDYTGKEKMKAQFEQGSYQTIDISRLQAGIYLLQIQLSQTGQSSFSKGFKLLKL